MLTEPAVPPAPVRRVYLVHIVREIDGIVLDVEHLVPGSQMLAFRMEQELMPGRLLTYERKGYVDA